MDGRTHPLTPDAGEPLPQKYSYGFEYWLADTRQKRKRKVFKIEF